VIPLAVAPILTKLRQENREKNLFFLQKILNSNFLSKKICIWPETKQQIVQIWNVIPR